MAARPSARDHRTRADADDQYHQAARRLLAGPVALATLDLAFYEVGNVAVCAWDDVPAARRVTALVDAIAEDGGLVRVDEALIAHATEIAAREGLSVYDAAYVAGAAAAGARLVSCDVRDLVSRGLALAPDEARVQDG